MPPKRKRAPDMGTSRPSPHRPGDTALGQHDRNFQDGGSRYGGRGGGGGGIGSRPPRRIDRRDSQNNASPAPSSSSFNPPSPNLQRPPSASSQPNPAAAPSSSAQHAAAEPGPPSPIASGYEYDIMTDARVANWAGGGRQEVVEHGVQSREDEDPIELSTIFQELLQSCLDHRLRAAEAGSAVKDILGPQPDDAEDEDEAPAFDPHTLFLDAVAIFMDVDTTVHAAQLRDFMIATGISPLRMRKVFEPGLLEQLGLIRDTFTKIGIRQVTNILYRQANYNLLREETEGYSKLITELFTTSNSEPPTADVVQAAFERVKGLIGTFDLDVGRALDVTLDVFAAVLIKQYRFFVKFLRVSSWWPRDQTKHLATAYAGGLPKWGLPESSHWTTSEEDEAVTAQRRRQRDVDFWARARQVQLDAFLELGGRQVADGELERLREAASASQDDIDPETQWIITTKTLPPPGNRTAAQLLGFKMRYYDSVVNDNNELIPANLFYMAALLIKIGFMSLCDLYPHISPADDKMEEVREARLKILAEEEREKSGASINALSQLGMLPDDEKDVSRINKLNAELRAQEAAAASAKVKAAEPIYQKVKLLEELLTLGAIPESLFILGRFPWLTEVFPSLLPLIHRLLRHSLEKVYQECRPRFPEPASKDTSLKKLPDLDQSGVPKGTVKLGQAQPKRPLRWPHPDGERDGQPYRCYWEDWADNVPVCQTVDDVFTLCSTLVNVSGVNIGRDAVLMARLAGIGAKSLADDKSEQNKARWQDLLKRLLVPALSLTEPNASVVNAVWSILKLYPITVRYNIYAEWYTGQISRLPAMRSAFARTRAATKSTLKRLSLQNLSAMAKKLAKTAYSSPGVVFEVSLGQIEAYSNLIQAFVECARYFTDLGYDVLVWSLMSSLGGGTRSRTQSDSILLTSRWLQALSKFSGQVFKRYANMKPTAVLQYVNNQLSKGNSTDLVILRELINSMAGVVSDADFTDAQLKAMTGGDVLRKQTLISLGDRRHESAKGAKRLMQSLVDTKLAGRLLINLAQYRQSSIYTMSEEDANIKYLATIMDEAHEALTQYLELLRSNLAPEQFDAVVPSVTQLMQEFGLDVTLAFMIGRGSLSYHMSSPRSLAIAADKDDPSQAQPAQASQDADGDVSMNGEAAATPREEDKMVLDDKDVSAAPADPNAPSTLTNGRRSDPFVDALAPIIDTVQTARAPEIWERLSPEFYVMFWSLQFGDLFVPQASYESEHERLNKEAEDVMKDRSDMSRAGMNRKDEKKRAFLDRAKSIREEMMNHVERYQKTRFRLAKLSKSWFPGGISKVGSISDAIIEQCLLPRLLLSASDTEYCFRMIKFLHENRAPNFKLLSLYERFFSANRLRSIIFSCTVREAEHLGRFIKLVLEDLTRWHWDRSLYEKEALGQKGSGSNQARNYLGFAKEFDEEGKPTAFIEHSSFQDSHYEWHKNLNIALKSCLAGMEWMHIRNAITVLKVTTDFFPAINFMGKQLLDQLDTIRVRESASKTKDGDSEGGPRVDLSVTAQTSYSALKKREPKWVMVQAFRSNMSVRSQDGAKAGDTGGAASNLRPTAPTFKPQPPANTPTQTAEVEDGEVKDGKDSKAATTVGAEKGRTGGPPSDNVATIPAKPGTPRPAPAAFAAPTTGPSRHEPARPTHQNPGADRTPHGLPNRPNLPSRPEVPIPGRLQVDRFGQIRSQDRPPPRDPREPKDPRDLTREARERDARDARDARDTRDPRDYRTPEAPRPERPRDTPREERRPSDSTPKEPGRLPERDRPARPEHAPRRGDNGPPERDSRPVRDRGAPAGGRSDSRAPREPAAPTPPPAAPSQPPAEEPLINPERAALLRSEERELINPARAALIDDSGGPPVRSPRDGVRPRGDRIERVPSRTQSPRRDERHGRSHSHHSEHPSQGRDVPGEPAHPQFRDRQFDRDGDREVADRGREAFQGPPPRHHDQDYSRQDPNYGRLNPIQSVVDMGTPSGPRGARGRTLGRGSMHAQPQPPPARGDGWFAGPDSSRPPSPDRHPPTGPSSSRQRRPQQGQFESATGSPGPAVAAASSSQGLHPDRAHLVDGPAQGAPVPLHPDRQSHIAPPPPPTPSGPPHPRSNASSGGRAPLGPAGPPGPRSGAPPPSTPGSDGGGPYSTPTGPASANERMRTGGRQLAGINSTLQQAGMPERGGRGNGPRRGGTRTSLPGSDAQVLTNSSPVSTPMYERQDPVRDQRGPPSGDPNALPPPPPRDPRGGPDGPDDHSSGRGDHDRSGRRDHRDRSDRSNRPSRRSSRERSPRGDREAKDARDYRDRRPVQPGGLEGAGSRDPERDIGPPRRPGRESSSSNREPLPGGGRDMMGNGREPRYGGRGDGRGDLGGGGGGGGRPGDEWGPAGRGGGPGWGGGAGGGGRPVDDRREPRGGEERGRKRRSGEDLGPPSDREKRPRR